MSACVRTVCVFVCVCVRETLSYLRALSHVEQGEGPPDTKSLYGDSPGVCVCVCDSRPRAPAESEGHPGRKGGEEGRGGISPQVTAHV